VLAESLLEPDPELLLSLESRLCSVGLSGSLGGVLDPLLDPVPPAVVLLELEPEPLSLSSFRCNVGLSESAVDVDELLPAPVLVVPESALPSFLCNVGLSESASFTTCGGCFDIGGFALTITTSGFTDPTAIHEPPRFSAALTLKIPLGAPACSSS
jgi:hypothetical protein